MKLLKNIVQGDTYKAKVIIKDASGEEIDPELISHVYFTSKTLNIQKDLQYDDDIESYLLSLTSTETQTFKPEVHTCDITVYFTNNNIKTVTYEGTIVVLAKHNAIA